MIDLDISHKGMPHTYVHRLGNGLSQNTDMWMGIIVHFVWSHTLHKCLSFERIAYISRQNILKKTKQFSLFCRFQLSLFATPTKIGAQVTVVNTCKSRVQAQVHQYAELMSSPSSSLHGTFSLEIRSGRHV